MAKTTAILIQIPPDKIKRNPDNPRIIFREREMQVLLDSIDEVGIRVPIIVYEERQRYVLIDGERRWRCATKLNLRAMPAIVHPKPTKLENILMMFNIHNVRVAWDLLPMAFKLREIRDLIVEQGQPTNHKHLAAITGLSAPTVKRAFELLDLPEKYQDLLLEEAKKPKEKQDVTADLFVEIIKSRNVIERYMPEVFDEVTPRKYLDSMVAKYRAKTIPSVTAFRSVSKIARAERAGFRALSWTWTCPPTFTRSSPTPSRLRSFSSDPVSSESSSVATYSSQYSLRALSQRASFSKVACQRGCFCASTSIRSELLVATNVVRYGASSAMA